jgi:eukaryotic-like serine/threonine-protein kinase
MATVYLAHDLKHDRRVALKVLKPELAALIGAERFLSEIKTTANLQHPHILPLHDSGDAGGLLFYVMPYSEGESLRDRMTREKHLPIADAVRIAGEVASALDYAHRHGVIHRDIKPENILLHDGRALVADFGIALAASSAGSRMTETGMSLGTPHYMSPEQAMGQRELDARTDVYALGAVLYEMLTGDPPFTGSTAQAIVAKVVTEKPVPPTRVRDTVPDGVEDAVLAALQKLPADRPASAAAFGALLSGGTADTGRRTAVRRVHPAAARLPWAVAGVLALALAVAGWRLFVGDDGASGLPPSRLALLAPRQGGTSTALLRQVAITPDGSMVYYAGVTEDGVNRTFRQALDQEEPEVVSAFDTYSAGYQVSPDGRWMFLIRTRDLTPKIYPLTGTGIGREVPMIGTNWSSYVAWGEDGSLWLTTNGAAISRLTPEDSVVQLPSHGEPLIVMQEVGRHSLLAVRATLGTASGAIFLVDTRTGERRVLLDQPAVEVRYAAGFLVWVDPVGAMRAVAFDPASGTTSGQPVQIASGVSVTGTGVAQFDLAANGTLVYLPEAPRSLMMVDRSGAAREATAERHNFHAPRFSRDGRRLSFDFTVSNARDVWLLELDSKLMTRVTFDADGHDGTWAPNGDLTYITAPQGLLGVLRVRPGSAAPPDSLFRDAALGYTGEWLPDGSALITTANGRPGGSAEDIALLTNAGKGPLQPLVETPASEQYPTVAPDGRWFAFSSNQSGREEVYLRRLDGGTAQIQVSATGGTEPVWSRDGRELFYRATGENAMLLSARVDLGGQPRVLSRTPLFSVAEYASATPHANYDVSPDGRQFAMVRTNPSARIMVIQNLPALVESLRGGGAP